MMKGRKNDDHFPCFVDFVKNHHDDDVSLMACLFDYFMSKRNPLDELSLPLIDGTLQLCLAQQS